MLKDRWSERVLIYSDIFSKLIQKTKKVKKIAERQNNLRLSSSTARKIFGAYFEKVVFYAQSHKTS